MISHFNVCLNNHARYEMPVEYVAVGGTCSQYRYINCYTSYRYYYSTYNYVVKGRKIYYINWWFLDHVNEVRFHWFE